MKDAEGNPLSIDRVLGVHAMYLGRDQGLVVINEKGIRN